MKRFFVSLFFLSGLVSGQCATADEIDPLWAKVVAHHDAMKKWSAKNVEQKITAIKDDEPPKLITILKEYKGWDKDKPAYTVLSITPPPKDASKSKQSFDLLEMFVPMEEKIFSNKVAVKRGASQVVNGQACATFDFTDTGMKFKLVVDEKSGAFVKQVVDLSMPFMVDGSVTTNYHAVQNGLFFAVDEHDQIGDTHPLQESKNGDEGHVFQLV